MYLKRVNVRNFSSFKETGWIKFEPGINLIVGQNNAGKSAFLRVFDQVLLDDRHRNADRWRSESLEPPEVDIDIGVSGEELKDMILKRGTNFFWPIGQPHHASFEKISSFLSEPENALNMRLQPNSGLAARPGYMPLEFPNPGAVSQLLIVKNGKLSAGGQMMNSQDNLPDIYNKLWCNNIFVFKAQRYSIGKYAYGREERLRPDASNLPAILATMQGDRGSIFRALISHLREVFSTVRNLSVTSLEKDFEVRVWATEEQVNPELGFPLDNCGTGVAQVIAILTVAMTLERAVIVIDEISSFLHPAAAKALLRIIQTN
jgi:hypothetical protein